MYPIHMVLKMYQSIEQVFRNLVGIHCSPVKIPIFSVGALNEIFTYCSTFSLRLRISIQVHYCQVAYREIVKSFDLLFSLRTCRMMYASSIGSTKYAKK